MKFPLKAVPYAHTIIIVDSDDNAVARLVTDTHADLVADVVNRAHAVVTADQADDEWAYLAALSQLTRAVRALEAL